MHSGGLAGLDAYLTTPPDDEGLPSGEAKLDLYRPWPRSDTRDGWLDLRGVEVDVTDGVADSHGLYRGVRIELRDQEKAEAEVQVAESAWTTGTRMRR